MLPAVLHAPGPVSALKLQRVPLPTPSATEVLIRIRAFGLNRSEMFTRQGHSPGITFPRILGIEAVGTVETAPPGGAEHLKQGDVVATCMGGMGRAFDGGYAEYCVVPQQQVRVVKLGLAETEEVDWRVLGALPEMMQTAWGSLVPVLRLARGDRLLIRGGTTGIGLAAAAVAKKMGGVFVVATTRDATREAMLREVGVDDVIVDSGKIIDEVRKRYPDGFGKVLELVGVTTMRDSMLCAEAARGVVCATGIAGGKWTFDDFSPSADIPTGVYLTRFGSSVETFMQIPLEEYYKDVVEGRMKIPIKSYRLEEIVEASRAMEEGTAGAKIVVLT